MRLHYSGKKRTLKKAVSTANELLNNPIFYDKISEFSHFDDTKISPSEISVLIEEWSKPVNVYTYWRPLGRSNAKTGSSSSISINTPKLRNRTNASIVNTLVHEYVHAVDYGEDGKLEFTHSSNSNPNGEHNNTAPWAIGKIAQQMVEAQK